MIGDPLLPQHDAPGHRPGSRTARWMVASGAAAIAAIVLVGVVATDDDDRSSAGTTVARTVTAPPATVAATTAVTTAPQVATTTAPPPTTAAPTVAATTAPDVARIDTPGDEWWLVNESRPISSDYVPPALVTPDVPVKPGASSTQLVPAAADALAAMARDARAAGHDLQITSAYRSFGDQQVLYDRFVDDLGAEAAASLVALPGTSEHQTGLAVDVGVVGLPDDQRFGDTDASRWVDEHAHEYGFIVRYPAGKSDVTGVDAEPWHLRYVGTELAATLHDSGLTMEEHFGLVPTTATTQAGP